MKTINAVEVFQLLCHYICQRSIFYSHACLFIMNSVLRKLAKKRKETMSNTRQEMTVMVNSMDKSYAEQGTNCDEAFSFMDTHNLNGRCKCTRFLFSPASQGSSRIPDGTGGLKNKKFLNNSYALLVSLVPLNGPGNFSCLGEIQCKGDRARSENTGNHNCFCKDLENNETKASLLSKRKAPASHPPVCCLEPICNLARCGITQGKPVIKLFTKRQ